MTGHHSWEKLMGKRYTPEERDRIRVDALKMLEEDDDRRGQAPAAGGDEGSAAVRVESTPARRARS